MAKKNASRQFSHHQLRLEALFPCPPSRGSKQGLLGHAASAQDGRNLISSRLAIPLGHRTIRSRDFSQAAAPSLISFSGILAMTSADRLRASTIGEFAQYSRHQHGRELYARTARGVIYRPSLAPPAERGNLRCLPPALLDCILAPCPFAHMGHFDALWDYRSLAPKGDRQPCFAVPSLVTTPRAWHLVKTEAGAGFVGAIVTSWGLTAR